jgi:cytochrome c oxidase subunit 2
MTWEELAYLVFASPGVSSGSIGAAGRDAARVGGRAVLRHDPADRPMPSQAARLDAHQGFRSVAGVRSRPRWITCCRREDRTGPAAPPRFGVCDPTVLADRRGNPLRGREEADMLDALFTDRGAFWMTLAMVGPFALVFIYVIWRKSVVDPSPAGTPRARISRIEAVWLVVVVAVFVAVNVASIRYMPTVATAHAATAPENVMRVDVSAQSWAFDLSQRKIEAGRPVRFSGRSTDTIHGFAVYHPDGRMLFTMMLMPGLKNPTSLVHTFKEPGRYRVRCLEYCGIAHHAMQDELQVVARSQ